MTRRKPVREHYNELARMSDPLDFSSQVERTVGGKPVSAEQVSLIVETIRERLDVRAEDRLLDLCCGNGYITDRIFAICRGGTGVDLSDVLISIANRHFKRRECEYINEDAATFAESCPGPERFTKVLCYGAFAYLTEGEAERALRALHGRFASVSRIFLGNLPDRSQLLDFYRPDAYVPGVEYDNRGPLGIWRTEEELRDLCSRSGWRVSVTRMPYSFFNAAYRYDALLERA